MNGLDPLESELVELRAKIQALTNLPLLSPEFGTWLTQLFVVIQNGFGAKSAELRELRGISPELPSEFYDIMEMRLQSLDIDDGLREQLIKQLHGSIPQVVYKRRLYAYEEFIGGCLLALRMRRK